jgi:hypothetical protein
VWVAESVLLGPNPGLPKSVCGGSNTGGTVVISALRATHH